MINHEIAVLEGLLAAPKKVVVLPHRKPDADALGSSLAVKMFLEKQGHTVTVVSPTDYPEFLFWMPGNDQVLNHEDPKHRTKAEQAIADADLFFCVDFSDLKRIEKLGDLVEKADKPIVLVDHHRGKVDFADFEYWDINASATCELIYLLIEELDKKELIDADIASCIYAGIMTDTGSFKFPATSSTTHRIAAEIKEMGIDTSKIHFRVFDTNSPNRLRFLGHILSQKLVFLEDYHTAFITISEKELKDFKTKTGDTEGLVNYGLSVKGMNLAAIFVQKRNNVKMSFRSKGTFSVAEMAAEYFNGGGHSNAAGGFLENCSVEDAVGKFKSLLEGYKDILSLPVEATNE